MIMMSRIFLIFWVLILTSSTVLSVPLYTQQKRQSDQRIAELETLLAMHKYGVGQPRRVGGRNSAGYGLIDFKYIGRRKKSTRSGGTEGTLFSPDQSLDGLHLKNGGNPFQLHRFRTTTGLTSVLHPIKGNQNFSGVSELSPPSPPFPPGLTQNGQFPPTHKDWVGPNEE